MYTDLLQKSVTVFFTENLCIQILLQKSVTVFLLKTYVYRFYYKKKCDCFFTENLCTCIPTYYKKV